MIGENPDSLSTLKTVRGLVTGNSYKFKYRASNHHGWGEFSDEVIIIAGIEPAKPEPIYIVNDGVNVLVSWGQSDNGGDEITKYEVEFKSSNSNDYYPYLDTCQDPYPSTTCTIPMNDFKFTPWEYSEGEIIIGRVRMINSINPSEWSDPNSSGATLQVTPYVPDDIIYDGDNTNEF